MMRIRMKKEVTQLGPEHRDLKVGDIVEVSNHFGKKLIENKVAEVVKGCGECDGCKHDPPLRCVRKCDCCGKIYPDEKAAAECERKDMEL